MKFRVGQGIDIHPFEKNRKLILGGVEVPHTHGLKGHSDADALIHAICDALLGALSLGDIGQHFSDKDPAYQGKESRFFLEKTYDLVKSRGWQIANIDTTLVSEEPTLRPHIEKMQKNIASILNLELDCVSIKATRPEKLGALGRKEGLMAFATTLLTST